MVNGPKTVGESESSGSTTVTDRKRKKKRSNVIDNARKEENMSGLIVSHYLL